MSLDLQTIGLEFQTDGLEKGTAALKNNEQAAHKAADAADNASSKMRIMSDAQKAAASATEKVRESIDKQVSAMRQQVETFGMSERQSKLYKLSIDGATESQLKQAEAALKQVDALKRAGEMGESAGRAIKVGALAAVAGIGATIAAFEMLIGKVSQYQDLAEQTGGDPAGIASLRTAADVGGASIEQLIASANRMQRSLAAVDDESKGVGRALGKIGIEVESFKNLRADEQIKTVAKAMAGYEDGLGKVAVMNEIFGRGSAALIPTMKELAAQTDTNNGLTTEQIQLADDYKDAQARAKSELMQFAEQMAVAALPMVTAFTGAVQDTLKELFSLDSQGNKLSKSNDVADFAEVAATSLASLVDIGYGVAQVFNLIGNNIGAALAQATEFAKGNFEGAAEIGRASNEFNSKLSFSLGLSEKLEARIKSIKSAAKDNPQDGGNEKQLEYHRKAAKAVKAVADEYAKLSAEIAKQLALSQAELDGNGKLEASEKYRITTLEKLIEQYQAGKITLKEYIDLESKMNDVQGVMEKAEAQAKAAKAAQAAYAESLQYQDDVNKALREEEDARNRIRLAVGANTVAAEEAQQLAQLEMQTVFASAEDRKRILDYYRIELDLRKKIAAINSAGGIDQAERDRLIAIEAENAARLKGVADTGAAMQSTTSIWQSIDQTAHTVWTNVLQGGQDVWSKLKNTAKSVFFDWLYQMTLKKWIFSIGATMTGTGAIAQTASSAGSLSSLSSLGSLGSSIASVSTALGQFGTSALASTQSLIGLTGTAAQAQAAVTGGLAAQTGASTMASTLGTAMPYIAAAAGVYMLAKSMEGGEKRSGATYTTGSKGEAVFNQGPSGGEIAADQSRGLFSSTQTEINRLLAGFGSKATVTGFTAGLESSKNGKGFQFAGGYIGDKAFGENLGRTGGQFSMQSQDDATALANYSTDLQRSVLEALQAADLGGSVGAWLNGLGDIEKLSKDQVSTNLTQVTAYQQLQEASKSYPAALDNIKTMTVEASAKLLEVAGGLDGLQTALASYFDLFGTDAEKYDQAIKTVHSGFDAINVVMPASNANLREWYKSEVARLGAMDLGVEANAKAYAGALKLASGVDALAKAEEQAATTRQNWQDQLNVLTGKTTDTALQMQRDLASTTDESTQALIRQVYAEKNRQKAMAESATAMQKMATDQAAAAQKSADAYKSALSAQQSYYASLTSAGDAVRNLLAGLKTGVNAGTSPQSRLEAARAQYLQDLSAARGGDFAAYNRVATTAQTYIGAGSDMYASGSEQKAILAQVQSELQNLPAVSQYDANLAQLKAIEAAIKSNTTSTNGAIGTLNTETLAAIASMTGTLSNNFASIDINNNGVLTFDELKAGLNISEELTRQLIASVDLNGDGQISQLEVIKANTANTTASLDAQKIDTLAAIASMTATLSNSFSTIDINGSGLITFAEMKEALGTGDTLTQQLINAIDANGDGQISQLEIINANTKGLADLQKINSAINSLDWSTASKASSTASLAAMSKANGWSLAQIAAASGYGINDISALFSGYGMGTGVAYGAISSSIETGIKAGTSGASTAAFVTGGGGAPAGGASSDAAISGAVGALDWSNPSASAAALANQAYWNNWSQAEIAASTGYNLSDIQALFANAGIPAFATGGDFAGGLRLVGERGPELEVTGPSRIFNAQQTASMLSGSGGNNQDLINEVRELRKEVAKAKESDTPIHVTVVTHDGKKLAEQVISTIKERSRNREVVIYANGVGAATR